jgi:hypothetical protein
MNKKIFLLVAVVLVLLGVYAVYFTSWFQPKLIQISHTSRPIGGRGGEPRLMFGLGNDYELTDVKVVSLAEWQTNKEAASLWHLVSDGSDDINRFTYGEKISGMDPIVDGNRPQKLQPGVKYLLLVTAGKYKGQHEFQIGTTPENVSTNN